MRAWIDGLRRLVEHEKGAKERRLVELLGADDALLTVHPTLFGVPQSARASRPRQRSAFDQLVEVYFRRRYKSATTAPHGSGMVVADAMLRQARLLIERDALEAAGAAAQQQYRRDHGRLPAALSDAERAELKLLRPKGVLPARQQLAVRVRESLGRLTASR